MTSVARSVAGRVDADASVHQRVVLGAESLQLGGIMLGAKPSQLLSLGRFLRLRDRSAAIHCTAELPCGLRSLAVASPVFADSRRDSEHEGADGKTCRESVVVLVRGADGDAECDRADQDVAYDWRNAIIAVGLGRAVPVWIDFLQSHRARAEPHHDHPSSHPFIVDDLRARVCIAVHESQMRENALIPLEHSGWE